MREVRGVPQTEGERSDGHQRLPPTPRSSRPALAPESAFETDGRGRTLERLQRLERMHCQLVSAIRREANQVATLLVTGLLRPVVICMLTATLMSLLLTSPSPPSLPTAPPPCFPSPDSPPLCVSSSSTADAPSEGGSVSLSSSPASSLRRSRSFVRDVSRAVCTVRRLFSLVHGEFVSHFFELGLDALLYVAVLTFGLALAIRWGWHRLLYYLMASSAAFSLVAGCGGAVYLFACRYLQPKAGAVTQNVAFPAGKAPVFRQETNGDDGGVLVATEQNSLLAFVSHSVFSTSHLKDGVSSLSVAPQLDTVLVLIALWNLCVGGAFALLWLAPLRIRSQFLVATSSAAAFTLQLLLLHFGAKYSPESPSTPTTFLLLCLAAWDIFAVLSPWGPLRWILQGLRSTDARPMPLLAYEASLARPVLPHASVRSARMASEPAGPGAPSARDTPSGVWTPGSLWSVAEPGSPLQRGEAGETRTGVNGREVRIRMRLPESGSRRSCLAEEQNLQLEPLAAGFLIQDERSRFDAEVRRRHISEAAAAGGDSQASRSRGRSRGQPVLEETERRGNGGSLTGVQGMAVTGVGQLGVYTPREVGRGGAEQRAPEDAECDGEGRESSKARLSFAGGEQETMRGGEEEVEDVNGRVRSRGESERHRPNTQEGRGAATREGWPTGDPLGRSNETETAEEREKILEMEIATIKQQLHRLGRGSGRAMLGLGDFVFYSLLACNLTSWSLATGLAGSVAVWVGLIITAAGTTFGPCHFLPALPLSIVLGLGVGTGVFYFVEPQAEYLISVDAFF
ncbi:presenilin [Toxoplasma gondii CAST]|uniref:Presenilin n=1 Tax=Toxoplasma gondii CAST TaxID=943122 RepID=A0A3R8GCA2_TOXGO|nr:presenilin [Toxoplasma gondii CAST]